MYQTGVGQPALWSRTLDGCLRVTKHLILGQMFLDEPYPQRSVILYSGAGWHPVGLVQPDHPVLRGRLNEMDPCPRVCYAFGADATGYPRTWCPPFSDSALGPSRSQGPAGGVGG
jgi:hypothetical protein